MLHEEKSLWETRMRNDLGWEKKIEDFQGKRKMTFL